jgi:hypothetical protein
MEHGPRLDFITRARALGALALTVVAVGSFQAGRDVEQPNGTQLSIDSPVSWVAAPVADFLEKIHAVDTPSKIPQERK